MQVIDLERFKIVIHPVDGEFVYEILDADKSASIYHSERSQGKVALPSFAYREPPARYRTSLAAANAARRHARHLGVQHGV